MQVPLALAKTCGRLAPFSGLGDPDSAGWMTVSLATVDYSTGEVRVHGPRSSRCHLADHFNQHVLLPCEDVVVTGGCVRCGRGYRSSFLDYVHSDGRCVRGRATRPRVFCLAISRSRSSRSTSPFFPREQRVGNPLTILTLILFVGLNFMSSSIWAS